MELILRWTPRAQRTTFGCIDVKFDFDKQTEENAF